MTSSYGSNFALLLAGFGWLAWLVWRTPSGPPVVNLPALARQSPNGHTISGHTFKGVKLEGPAMLFLTGTVRIQDNHFESVTFAQNPDTDPFVTGVIELHNCTVTNCVFDQIGFIGKESLLAKLRLGVAVVNLPQGLRVVPEIQR